MHIQLLKVNLDKKKYIYNIINLKKFVKMNDKEK